MIYLELPFPPSVNSYYRSTMGRVLISAKGRVYRRSVIAHVCDAKPEPFEPPYDVRIQLERGDHRQYDLDNCLKSLLDALEHSAVIQNDKWIDRLLLERLPCNPGTPGTAFVWVLPHQTQPLPRSGRKVRHTRQSPA